MTTVPTVIAPEELRALCESVASFHLRDKTIVREQRALETMLARGGEPDPAFIERYLRTVRTYFAGFHREAQQHLARIDRRLEHLAQLQFNATAERGVASRRIELTSEVLRRLDGTGAP